MDSKSINKKFLSKIILMSFKNFNIMGLPSILPMLKASIINSQSTALKKHSPNYQKKINI